MMETHSVTEMLVYQNHLMHLSAQEDFC